MLDLHIVVHWQVCSITLNGGVILTQWVKLIGGRGRVKTPLLFRQRVRTWWRPMLNWNHREIYVVKIYVLHVLRFKWCFHPLVINLCGAKYVHILQNESTYLWVWNNNLDLHLSKCLFSHYLSQNEVTQWWLSLWPTDENLCICNITDWLLGAEPAQQT